MMAETFHGYIETTQDVLLIFEGCRRGLLPRICRRLQERERNLIRSGSIFVFDERESGNHKSQGRNTESLLGIKRWTDGRVWSPSRILGNFLIYRELDKKIAGDRRLSSSSGGGGSSNNNTGRSFSLDGSIDRQKEKQLIGSLSDSYKFKEDGLIKKTMSISVNGVAQHLISYYNPKEVIENRLRLPSTVPELASLEISPELLVKQNFRVPPLVEPSFDQNECDMDSRHHAYRSMSVGSIRGPPPDLPVYPSFPRLDMERSLYGQSMSPNIPSNITPSPSTPMIPQRPPYHHQRHYSTSSTYRSDAEPQPENMYTDNTRHEERLATPNLVQLLNPIHPLNSNTMEYTYPYNKQEMHYNTYEKQSIKSEQENYPYEKQAAMNYMSYQPGHPLNNSVENLMFQNNSSFPQQQESTNMGPLINGLK